MPRIARSVFPHLPHHVTQRGNRGEDVFFDDEDREIYLLWLREYALDHGVEVAAYCLMTNHIHLILTPSTEDGLQKVLKPLHMRYAQRLNRARQQLGHVWQGR
jgi:putative transposase